MGVHDVERFPFLSAIKSFIREVAAQNIPFLGVCLGGQLLADALGAHVHSGRHGEKGVYSIRLLDQAGTDPLFHGLPVMLPTFQWHDDSFELPNGAVLLASTDSCVNQAFRYGRSMYGLQFHPEVTREIVDLWSRNSEVAPTSLHVMKEFIGNEEAYLAYSRLLFENFLRIAGLIG